MKELEASLKNLCFISRVRSRAANAILTQGMTTLEVEATSKFG